MADDRRAARPSQGGAATGDGRDRRTIWRHRADSPKLEPYYALAEELDIPVGIYVGPGPPGVSYFGSPKYRMRLSNPLALEDVLMRHPKMRLYVMHAGWPFADEMVALMFSHPQVYVDVGVIDFAWPRADFMPI